MTVFSAPDYPQFQPINEDRFNNLGAVAVLRGSHGNYTSPELVEYSAVPRPQVNCHTHPACEHEPKAGMIFYTSMQWKKLRLPIHMFAILPDWYMLVFCTAANGYL